MPAAAPTDLARFIAHAERYGIEGVYEIAVFAALDAGQLQQLARRLREIDVKWRPPRMPTATLSDGRSAQDATRPLASGSAKAREISRTCGVCGDPLDGYRADATVCRNSACRKRAQRTREAA